MLKKLLPALAALALLAAACGDDSADTTPTDTAPTDTTPTDTAPMDTAPMDTAAPDGGGEEPAEPVTGPATIGADDQTGDGTTVTVASVSLPVDGFVVIHANADGAPGPVIGHSDLLPAGDNTDVVVTLDTPLDTDDMVFPMAHVDANANGVYEFSPPDDTTDVPATTADGAVAVLGIDYTVG